MVKSSRPILCMLMLATSCVTVKSTSPAPEPAGPTRATPRDDETAAVAGSTPQTVADLVVALCGEDGEARQRAAAALVRRGGEAVPHVAEAIKGRFHGDRVASAAASLEFGPDAVDALARALRDEDWSVRYWAASMLARLGPDAEPAVAQLVRVLSQPGAGRLWDVAARSLTAIGSPAVPALLEMLRDPARGNRYYAVTILGSVDGQADVVVPALIEALGPGEQWEPVRWVAAATLARFGRAAVPAAGELVRLVRTDERSRDEAASTLMSIAPESVLPLLRDDDAEIREAVVGALRLRGEEGIAPLIEALGDDEANVRRKARWSLARIGRAAIPALLETLGDAVQRRRDGAAIALARVKDVPDVTVHNLVDMLRNGDARRRAGAADALGRLRRTAHGAVDALAAAVKDEDPDVRYNAVWGLTLMGSLAGSSVRAVESASADESSWVRAQAATALVAVGAEAEVAVPRLVSLLQDPAPPVRLRAAEALGKLGEHAVAAAPRVIPLLQDPEPKTRASAAEALRLIGGDPDLVVPALTAALGDTEENVRYEAAYALKETGSEYRTAAVPALIEALRHDDFWRVRRMAADMLPLTTKQPDAVQAMIAALEDGHECVRREVADSMEWFGDAAAPAVPALARALVADQDVDVRKEAATTLGELGTTAAEAVPALMRALADSQERCVDGSPRLAAAKALAKVGPSARTAVPALAKELDSADRTFRAEVARALVALGADSTLVVPPLVEILEHGTSYDWDTAAEVLGELGPGASVAIPALLPVLDSDAMAHVRMEAGKALARIGADPEVVVPSLRKTLSSRAGDTWLERQTAIEALKEFGPRGRAAVPDLIEALSDANFMIASAAVDALAAVGPGDDRVIPALVGALGGDISSPTSMAVERKRASPPAMTFTTTRDGRAGPDLEVVTDISQISWPVLSVTGGGEVRRDNILAALRAMGPAARSAVPSLVRLLASRELDPGAKVTVLRSILAIDRNAVVARESVEGMLEGDDVLGRVLAAFVLAGEANAGDEPDDERRRVAPHHLADRLRSAAQQPARDDDTAASLMAAAALVGGDGSAEGLRLISAALTRPVDEEHPRCDVNCAAAWLLGILGRKAAGAETALREARELHGRLAVMCDEALARVTAGGP